MSGKHYKRAVLISISYQHYEVSEKEALAILKALNGKQHYRRNYDVHELGGPDFVLEDNSKPCDVSIETGTIGPKPYKPPPPRKVLSIEHKPAMKLLPGMKGGEA